MKEITVNLSEKTGTIKPMHAVNNGPVFSLREGNKSTGNLNAYKEAGIPYARNHDASIYYYYGGEHIVDITAIFPDFSKDPYDEDSYDFYLTDEYLKGIEMGGAKCFYRLGQKIEHWKKKYNVNPPENFEKWAIICEHIIRHYNYGWANGFEMGLEYWEIWNEPDGCLVDKACWAGTIQQYFELYDITSKHLKKKFPELKIGGPALAYNLEVAEEFLKQLTAPLDFFSWHIYSDSIEDIMKMGEEVQKLLDKYGYSEAENILDEWNYLYKQSWVGEEWAKTLRDVRNMRGAAYNGAVMCRSQKSPIDMLMYYDARPTTFNGMFHPEISSVCLKGYYPFKAFNELYKLGDEVKSETVQNFYTCAARKDDEAAIMVVRYADSDSPELELKERLKINMYDFGKAIVEYYVLNEEHDLELVREEIFESEKFSAVLDFKGDTIYLIKLRKQY